MCIRDRVLAGAPEPCRQELTLEEAAALARRRMEEGLSATAAAKEAAAQSLSLIHIS